MLKFLRILFCLPFLTAPAAFGAESDVISEVYRSLERDYINHQEPAQITLKGLKVLNELDAAVRVAVSGRKLYLYKNNRVAKTFDLPSGAHEPEQWAELSRKVIAEAVRISDKVELMDFEIPDRFAKAVFAGLDGYSHYYGEFAGDGVEKQAVRRQFAVRMIDDVMLIKIVSFQAGTSQKVSAAVAECSACRGVVLDLRGNHGGVLDEAVKTADLFLDEGIIAYTAEKDGENPKYYTAAAGDITGNKPLAVLIDGFSASASEVLAAALSEQNRAVLIGTESYGKGTIQDVYKLGGNRAMALTTAYFFTPSGFKIDGNGLNPAVCTGGLRSAAALADGDCKPADRFNQEAEIETAVKYIKNEL